MKFNDGGSPSRKAMAEVENATVKASDLPTEMYSVEKIEWFGNAYGVQFQVKGPPGQHILPDIVAATLAVEVDAAAARRQVDEDPFRALCESEPVSLESASAARSYQAPVITPDGSPGLSVSVLFSVRSVSGFVTVMGSEHAVHIRQAEALAERVVQRLVGKKTSRRPAFRPITQWDLEQTDALFRETAEDHKEGM